MSAIEINRAPVLTLWAAVVAERLGYEREAALTLGRAVAGMNAKTKAELLGLIGEKKTPGAARRRAPEADADRIELLGRRVPVIETADGLRAAKSGKPDSAASVERYLAARFGEALEPVRRAMTRLAAAWPQDELAAHAFSLYESFRPEVPRGAGGWGATGVLDLARIDALARERKSRR